MYGTNNSNTAVPYTITVYDGSAWHGNNYPIERQHHSGNRRLAKLDRMIARFGRKVAEARHDSIVHATAIIMERLRRVRRSGALLLTSVVRLVQRRGRVCGEANYYRVMLC